jgi:hypothetical protein
LAKEKLESALFTMGNNYKAYLQLGDALSALSFSLASKTGFDLEAVLAFLTQAGSRPSAANLIPFRCNVCKSPAVCQ